MKKEFSMFALRSASVPLAFGMSRRDGGATAPHYPGEVPENA
ncbi:MAG TPA: hypothetical protein VMX16_13955 [Terriglobia bacterium]|nr:hypothetical protein [Terriglobia bacterium]